MVYIGRGVRSRVGFESSFDVLLLLLAVSGFLAGCGGGAGIFGNVTAVSSSSPRVPPIGTGFKLMSLQDIGTAPTALLKTVAWSN